MLKLADLFEALCGIRPEWASEIVIPEASIDSRHVIPGCIFVALPGQSVDGHDFVGEAFKRGASLAFVQQDLANQFATVDLRGDCAEKIQQDLNLPLCIRVEDSLVALQKVAGFWRRRLNLRVIGITGSVGKSTTKEVTAEVLSQRFRTLKNPGNLNNEIGLPLTVLSLSESYERAVLEMGFYVPGEIQMLCDIALPQVGVITNIGTVHAERAGSQEMIAKGKSELIQSLPPAPDGVAILNYDDLRVREMAELTSARIFYYGLDPAADLWADRVEGLGLDGIRFRLHYQNEVLYLRVPLIGRHSVHTVLRAAAVGLVEGLTWQEIVNGLRSERTQLRLMTVRSDSGALILDDTYNASPESTLAALNLLEELGGRKVAVLGDMLELGPYEQQGHEMVGFRAAQVVNLLITIGERGKLIAGAARKGGLPSEAVLEMEGNQEAVKYLRDKLGSQDVVLVKGSRGMQMEVIVEGLEANR